MYLVDTNVISELRRGRQAHPAVQAWAQSTPVSHLYLSVITLLELETGIRMIARRDDVQGAVLRRWFETGVQPAFLNRILPIDSSVALRCAALHVPDRRPERDALIAATALVHGFTVITRNGADFAPTGVTIINPWA
jgi:toxin FitB